MKQEAIQNQQNNVQQQQTQLIEEIDQYNCFWKQDIILSDCEEQILDIVTDEEKDNNNNNNNNLINLGKALDIQPSSGKQLEKLNYLDTPQLRMTSLQSSQNVINYFIPNNLISTLTEMLNNYLQIILSHDKKQESQQIAQQMFNKKKYKDQEVQYYFALQILFGLYRFPQLDDYWRAEPWFRGGIESAMHIGRFKFVDMHIFTFYDDQQKNKLTQYIRQFKQKLKALYNPDQELILVQQIYQAYTTYYIFDYDSSQIIDLLIICNNIQEQEKITKIFKMLNKYSNQNHIIYFMFEIDIERISQLVDLSIYPVICYKNIQHNLIQMLQEGVYELDQLFLIKQGEYIYLQPQKKLISNRPYITSYKEIKEQLKEHLDNLQQFRSSFYFSSQLNKAEGFYQLRVEFEEYFEIMIHNTFLLINQTSLSDYRHELAMILLGEKGQQIERERQQARRKVNCIYKDNQTNTDQLTFGLQNTYAEQYHTPIPQKQEDTFKYCLVCMKFDGLTKPYYRCQLCEKILNQRKIFLCPFPCFELFHRNPSEFIDCDIKLLEGMSDGVYFKNESAIQLVNQNQEEDTNKKKKNKPPPRSYWSYNKEIYKATNINDDQNFNEIINTFNKKPVLPSPNLLQSIVPQEQQINQSIQGHKKDMKDLENKLNQEKELKEQQLKEIKEKEKQRQEQFFQQQYEKQLQMELEPKKSKKQQKENEKKKLQEQSMKNSSLLEQYMDQMNKRTKLEDGEQQ